MWNRDLDVVMPMWQGADDVRLRDGAAALAALTAGTSTARVVVACSSDGSPREGGVRHRSAVLDAWRAQAAVLQQHQPERLLTLGGDCAVEVTSVAHLHNRYAERLFVLWIDAHGDLNTPLTSPSGTAHGMPLRLLLDPSADPALSSPGCLSADQVALVGTRNLDPPEVEFLRRHQLTVVDVPALTAQPDLLAELPPPGAAVYVHLDLDVLDPVELPAVAVPTPGGLSPHALAAALNKLLASHDLVGIGIAEYVPQVQHDTGVLIEVLDSLGLTTLRNS